MPGRQLIKAPASSMLLFISWLGDNLFMSMPRERSEGCTQAWVLVEGIFQVSIAIAGAYKKIYRMINGHNPVSKITST